MMDQQYGPQDTLKTILLALPLQIANDVVDQRSKLLLDEAIREDKKGTANEPLFDPFSAVIGGIGASAPKALGMMFGNQFKSGLARLGASAVGVLAVDTPVGVTADVMSAKAPKSAVAFNIAAGIVGGMTAGRMIEEAIENPRMIVNMLANQTGEINLSPDFARFVNKIRQKEIKARGPMPTFDDPLDQKAAEILRGTLWRGQGDYPRPVEFDARGNAVFKINDLHVQGKPDFSTLRPEPVKIGEPIGVSTSADIEIAAKFALKAGEEEVARVLPLYGTEPEKVVLKTWNPEHQKIIADSYLETAKERLGAVSVLHLQDEVKRYDKYNDQLKSIAHLTQKDIDELWNRSSFLHAMKEAKKLTAEQAEELKKIDFMTSALQNRSLLEDMVKNSYDRILDVNRFQKSGQDFNANLTRKLESKGFKGILYSPKRYDEVELKIFDPKKVMVVDRRKSSRMVNPDDYSDEAYEAMEKQDKKLQRFFAKKQEQIDDFMEYHSDVREAQGVPDHLGEIYEHHDLTNEIIKIAKRRIAQANRMLKHGLNPETGLKLSKPQRELVAFADSVKKAKASQPDLSFKTVLKEASADLNSLDPETGLTKKQLVWAKLLGKLGL